MTEGSVVVDEKIIIKKLSKVGIFGNIILAAFKLFAGILGRSGAMISDAVHSLSYGIRTTLVIFTTFVMVFSVIFYNTIY